MSDGKGHVMTPTQFEAYFKPRLLSDGVLREKLAEFSEPDRLHAWPLILLKEYSGNDTVRITINGKASGSYGDSITTDGRLRYVVGDFPDGQKVFQYSYTYYGSGLPAYQRSGNDGDNDQTSSSPYPQQWSPNGKWTKFELTPYGLDIISDISKRLRSNFRRTFGVWQPRAKRLDVNYEVSMGPKDEENYVLATPRVKVRIEMPKKGSADDLTTDNLMQFLADNFS